MNKPETATGVPAHLFRKVMGRFATGVTVISAEVDGEVRGMTANAFMSGSLTPPLCIISVATKARMHGHLLSSGRFGVNILAEGQEAISGHFAGRSVDHLEMRFDHVAGIPLLDGASAVIAAEIEVRHDCGDHSLFIGRILHMRDHERPPLVYHAGRYGSLLYAQEQAAVPVIEFW